MNNNLSNSEKMGEIIDKIFLQNHHIINLMLSSYREEEFKRVPLLNAALEKVLFDKLSEHFEELRTVIRESLEISDEINTANIEEYYGEDAKNEIITQSREKTKTNIINAIKSRIQGLFVSMNFVPITFKRDGQETPEVVESIYYGTPEEALRALEFSMLNTSVDKQIDIIDYEDYFEKKETDKVFTISPMISPSLIDAIALKSKYTLAEKNCKKFSEMYREQEDLLEEYPELRETTEFAEYLMLEERYKAMFEQATGLLNSRTTYGSYFFSLYKNGNLPLYTGFSQEEISQRIKGQTELYVARNKEIINQEYIAAKKRYRAIKIKRSLGGLADSIKIKRPRIKGSKKYMTRSLRLRKVDESENSDLDKKESQPEDNITPKKGNNKKIDKRPGEDGENR